MAKKLSAVLDKKTTDTETPAAAKKAAVKTDNFDKIRQLTSALNKSYGFEAIKTGDKIPHIVKVPLDEPTIDYVCDGGFPVSRIIEALGQEHSGKTRNGLIAMGKWQKFCFNCNTPNAITSVWKKVNGSPELVSCSCSNCSEPKTGVQLMVDIEGTTDPKFMHLFGIDTEGVLYTRPKLFSEAVDIVDAYIRNPAIGLIMVDSVASIGGDKEIENKMQDNKMNQNALMTNQAMRKWQAALNANTNEDATSPTTVYVVNQSYSSIGMFSTEIAQGGRGLRHGKGISLKTRIQEKVMQKSGEIDYALGYHIVIENMKNKTGIPYRKMSYYIHLEAGHPDYCKTDKYLQILDMAIILGVVENKGSWYYLGNDSLGQGKDKVIIELKKNQTLFDKLKTDVYLKMK